MVDVTINLLLNLLFKIFLRQALILHNIFYRVKIMHYLTIYSRNDFTNIQLGKKEESVRTISNTILSIIL